MGIAFPRPLSLPTGSTRAEAGRITPGAPPWIWAWVVLFLWSFPNLWATWQFSIGQLPLIRESTARLREQFPHAGYGRLEFLSYPAVLLDFLPSAALLLGLAAALFPSIRGRFVQQRYGVTELPRDDKRLGETIREIEAFVQAHAPGLALVWSKDLSLSGPFVFPTGYRRSALTINPKFLLWWKQDPQAAKAVLLHEMGHFHRGDGAIIGVGSAFETVVRWSLPAYLILFVGPFLIQYVVSLFRPSPDPATTELLAQLPPAAQLAVAKLTAMQLLQGIASYLFWFASFFVLPVAAIWAAEFGADRFAADSQGSTAGIAKIIGSDAPKSWRRRLLDALTHPPARLRAWMLARRVPSALALLALILPIAYLVRPLLLQSWAVLLLSAVQVSPADIREMAIDNTFWYFHTVPRAWLVMAALLVLWPFIVRGWERLMTGEPGVSSRSNVPVYWACAVPLLVLAAVGFSLGGVLASRVAARAAAVETVALESAVNAAPAPGLAPPGIGASRDAPAPLGTEVFSGDLGLAVAEVASGDDAWSKLQEASMVANEPPAGAEYVLARVRARNTGDEPIDLDPFQFGLTASGNVVHEAAPEIPPDPWLDITIDAGMVAEGWVVLTVGEEETGRQLVYLGDLFAGQPVEGWRFLALEEDAALPPGELAHPWAN